jgi:hypothetical protein
MKKIVIIATLMATVAGAFAQGTVLFNNRNASTGGTDAFIAVDPSASGTANGQSAGARLIGTGWTAQLWAANGGGAAEASLTPATPTTTFRTSTSGAGLLTPTTATLSGVPKDAPTATIQMRVWDNRGGTILTWAQVLADPSIFRGSSSPFNVNLIGGDFNAPPPLNPLQAFNVAPVPEPSTIALGMLGVGSLLVLRRRK